MAELAVMQALSSSREQPRQGRESFSGNLVKRLSANGSTLYL